MPEKMKTKSNIYQENGYNGRIDYLKSLADDFGVGFDTVIMLSDILGESEDFDGLVCALEDIDFIGQPGA